MAASPSSTAAVPSRRHAARAASRALHRSAFGVEGLESRTLFAANGVLANGVDPNHLGKGDWIAQVPLAVNSRGVSNADQLFDVIKAQGVKWVAVRAANGDQLLTQFNKALVDAAHADGLQIFGYGHVYGGFQNISTVNGEIDAAKAALALGADGYIFEAEGEFENLGLTQGSINAQRIANAVRSAFPDTFLAYSTFAQPSQHPNFAYQAWSSATDAVMPKAYWQQLGVSPSQMVTVIDDEFNNLYGSFRNAGAFTAIKPIAPVGQGFGSVTGTEIVQFTDALEASTRYAYDTVLGNSPYGGYGGVSFFSAQDHSTDVFNAIGQVSIGEPAAPDVPTPGTGALLNASPILLKWAPTPRATSYDVFLDGVNLGNFVVPQVGLPTALADGLHLWQVTANNAVGSTQGPLWAFQVDVTPPSVQSVSVNNLTVPGGTTHEFSITFTDNLALDVASLRATLPNTQSASAAVQIINSGGTVFPARFVSIDNPTNGTPRTVTFSFDAPGTTGSVFDAADNDVYTILLNPDVIKDETGNAARITVNGSATNTGPIATFSISANAPTATLGAAPLTTPGGATYEFDVTYTVPDTILDNSNNPIPNPNNLDVQTIGTGDVVVVFPDGTRVIPDLVSPPFDTTTPTKTATARYRFDAPGGIWDSADNGNYTVLMQGPKVRDTAGNFVPPTQLGGALGTITVNVSTVLTISPVATTAPETALAPTLFTVTRTGATDAALTINYTVAGTATAGADYDALPGTLTFAAGSATATIAVQPRFDLLTEGDEVVAISLVAGPGFTPGNPAGAALTISDTLAPGISVADTTVKEPGIVPTVASFTVTLSAPWPEPITFNYATSAGTATAGEDFTAASGVVTLAPGQTSVVVTIPVLPDFTNEADETFFLSVTPASNNAGVVRGTGQATIQNQTIGFIPFGGGARARYFDSTGQQVTVSLSGPGTGNVLVLAEERQPTNALGIVLDANTTNRTTLNVSSRRATAIRTLQLGAAVGTVNAQKVVLNGNLTSTSTVRTLRLAGVNGGAMTFGAGPDPLSATLGTVSESSLTHAGAIRSLGVTEWLDAGGTADADPTADVVSAASVGTVSSQRNFAADILSTSDIATLKINGRLDGAAVRAAGSIGTVTVGATRGSLVYAGLSPTQSALPAAASEFTNPGASIDAFTVRSKSIGAFAATRIAAPTLGDVRLGDVTTNNGGSPFGVSASAISAVRGSTPVGGPFNVQSPVTGTIVSEGDFIARVL